MLASLVAAVALQLTATPSTGAPPPAIPPISPTKIILVGDSTTAVMGGWGSSFCADHVTASVACVNLARPGRSTSSYVIENSWELALAEMSVPGYVATYVLIQFGHNDQPGKPRRSTDLATEFPANLRRYVAETRERGAVPVLVTPLTRRIFVEDRLENTLEPWAETIRAIAAETGAPLVDLNVSSAAAVQALGPSLAARFQAAPSAEISAALLTGTTPTLAPAAAPAQTAAQPRNDAALEPPGQAPSVFDYTHLAPVGADFFAAIVARDLMVAVPDLRPSLAP
ncbi:rhamnogalacturonan acetylesterase [Brevundimonas sp.]